MEKFDYLIVGGGLAGAVKAYQHSCMENKNVAVVEKKPHIGGFCYTSKEHGIDVHRFGAHIFRTDRKDVWDFVNSICEFIPFVNSPIANYRGELFNLPFNMNTFYQLYGVSTPQAAREAIEADREERQNGVYSNMEDVVLSKCGRKMYEKLIKGYSEKQWGRPCNQLPPDTMAHIPMRMTFDNNYYAVTYQGIPEIGYTEFLERLMDNATLFLRSDFNENRERWKGMAERIIYTGRIDEYFDFCFGPLEYRSVRFEHKWMPNTDNHQGVAVMNFTDATPEYTRCIEHKHFFRKDKGVRGTMLSYEYPSLPDKHCAPIYPVLDQKNLELLARYMELAEKEENVTFFGQLAEFKPYSMSELIERIL